MVRLAVTGPRGMLGRRVMERFPEAVPIMLRSTGSLHDPMLDLLERIDPDWVINCAGAVDGEADMWSVNAMLPHRIAHRWRLIQPSTDHVDDDTEYARSKRLGEAGVVIRCAIVDPDGGTLARARRQDTEGQRLREWNGITARAWAKVAEDLIGADDGVYVAGSPTMSHAEMLTAARLVMGWPTRTIEVDGREWRAPVPDILLPAIDLQLRAYW